MLLSKHTPTLTYSGNAGVLEWRTPSGIRVHGTSKNKTLSLDVVVGTNQDPSGNRGIKRVYYEIVPNGGSTIYKIASNRGLRKPNHHDYSGRMPFTDPTRPSPIWGYGLDLDLTTMPMGTLVIRARMETMSGNFAASSYLTVYNDSDGGDRRSCRMTLYVDEVNGSPAGPGALDTPFGSVQQAIEWATDNSPSGSDLGGLVIRVLSDLNGLGSSGADTGWFTGSQVLRVVSHNGRHTFRTETPGTLVTSDTLGGACVGGASTIVSFEGFHIEGLGFNVEKAVTSSPLVLRDVDCTSTSKWAGSIQAMADDGQPTACSDATGTAYESIGHTRSLTAQGLLGRRLVSDCQINLVLDQALTSETSIFVFSNVLVDAPLSNVAGEVSGFVDLENGVGFEIQAPYPVPSGYPIPEAPGEVMRVQSTVRGGQDFAVLLAPLVGLSYWGITVTGSANPVNDVVSAAILGVGYDRQGLPYVDLWNPGTPISETMTASGRITTTRIADDLAYDSIVVQPSCYTAGAAINGGAICGLRVVGEPCVALDTSGVTVTRLFMEDVAVPDGFYVDLSSATFTHLLVQNCAFLGEDISFSAAAWTGSSILDTVFGFGPATFPSGYVAGCHFVTGTSYGIEATTGPWADPGDDMSPLTTQQRTAVGPRTQLPLWGYSGPRPFLSDWVRR
ncbi:MAG: hypothetical protein H6590_06125 [Flavobacteriales bacterium]|nr:hypothetical protein [Flavobacteriales bacterium]